MPYRVEQGLILLAVLSSLFTPAQVQIAMPVYMQAAMPQTMYAVPAPVPVAVAIHLPERVQTTTTTTTTTPEPQYAIAVPVPMPMPMPVPLAVPPQPPPVYCQNKPRPNSCPPCPPCVCLPSCTPAFFSYCSPCHQKCRCRNPAEAPVPLPPSPPVPVPGSMYPMPMVPGPAPVVVVPLPPIIRTPVTSYSDSDTSGSCDDTDERHYSKNGKKFKKGRIKILKKRKFRRDARDKSEENGDLVKPVISYISENGDVQFETKLSNKDAMKILSEGMIKTSEEKTASMESDDDSVVITKGRRKSGRKYNQVMLRESPTNQKLKKGENEFVFKPSSNKKINSVAVSFKVT